MWNLKLSFYHFLGLFMLYGEWATAEELTKSATISQSCATIMTNTSLTSGVYWIDMQNSQLPPFKVYCDWQGWTIIQRRRDGSENFYRNWQDYKTGFGDLYGEYWLGLDKIHAITRNQPQELWIYLQDYSNNYRNAYYSLFYVGGEADSYRLSVGGYSGDAGDGMTRSNNMKFSTFDNNNSYNGNVRKNCAVEHIGAFWYEGCANTNPNGLYRQYSNRFAYTNIFYLPWLQTESMKYIHMAVRPIQS